jgi:hypothetical protein
MADYKITAVSQTVREYDTKFGAMKSYKLKLEGVEEAVELGQKASTPSPAIGDVLSGTIDTSGGYGPKFKKEFNQQSGGGSGRSFGGGGSKHVADPFTMFLSYAKDLVVALQETSGFDAAKYQELLKATLEGGKALYNGRPGADTSAPTTNSPISGDDLVKSWGGKEVETVDDAMNAPLNIDDIPF